MTFPDKTILITGANRVHPDPRVTNLVLDVTDTDSIDAVAAIPVKELQRQNASFLPAAPVGL